MPLSPVPTNTPTEAAFHAMVRSTVLVRRVMEPYFARHGISGAQWGVLRALHRAESNPSDEVGGREEADERDETDGVRMTDLSARLLVRTPSVSGVVTRLERLGLVRRHVSADDHRARRLQLTPAGRQLVARVLAGHAERMESLLAPLAAGQREDLARLLGRVADHLEVLADCEEIRMKSEG
jgi:DNA-binding MarR family transcriptional regulator